MRRFWLVLVLAGCGQVEVATVQRAIVGGVASGADQGAVVKLTNGCTGTVLAPNLVLTARHCVAALPAGSFYCDENGEGIDGGAAPQYGALSDPTRIMLEANGSSTNPALPNAPTSPRGKSILVPAETSRCKTDIALVVLDPAIDDPVIAPIQLERAPAAGDAITAVGWGLTEDAGTLTSPRRREVSVLVVGPARGSTPDDAVWPHFFTVGQGPCYGDSGSPARSPSGAVVGVASYINFPTPPTAQAIDCENPAVTGGYASVVHEKAFLIAGFQQAGATPWIDGMPNPRDSLLPFEAACSSDGECQSNACSAGSCTHGCAESVGATPCPAQYTCQVIDDRQRCVKAAEPDAGSEGVAPHEGAGCSAGGFAIDGLPWVLLALVARSRLQRRVR